MNNSSQITTTVQTPLEFYYDFIESSRKASNRIWLQSMNLEGGNLIQNIIDTISKASENGIDVRLNIDWVANKYVDGKLPIIPLLHPLFLAKSFKVMTERKKLYQQLVNAGVIIITTNTPTFIENIIPIIGRNHTKMYLVDNETAWIGGINMMDYSFENEDFMVKIKNKILVKMLADHFTEVNSKRPKQNYTKNCIPGYTILIDVGIRGNSLIYNEAIKMVESAKKSIVFISQLIPDKKLLSSMINKTKQGISVSIITSNKEDAQFSKYPYKYFYNEFISHIRGNSQIKLIHAQKKVHAKLLITDDQQALFGSHNLVWAGVALGTEELSIHSTDKMLLQQLKSYITDRFNIK